MVSLAMRERSFLLALVACFASAALFYDTPHIAMWLGFMFAGYSAVANDSIQTIGTFIASNKARPWWLLWLFIGGIFVATTGYSWWNYGAGLQADYYANAAALQAGGESVHSETYSNGHLDWTPGRELEAVPEGFAVELSGTLEAPSAGQWTLAFTECSGTATAEVTDAAGTIHTINNDAAATVPFDADARLPITMVYVDSGEQPDCTFSWRRGDNELNTIPARYMRSTRWGGDVSYGRLASKGFDRQPENYAFLQIAAPIFLLILTRLRMPVSTTTLLLTCFATSAGSVGKVLVKSFSGYVIAFVCAIILWMTLGRAMQRWFTGQAKPYWSVLQWVTTGTLWSVWLQQDAANIAVYLPRHLSPGQYSFFAGFIFIGLGVLFYMRGERIQSVVEEKSSVADVRPATIIDLLYAIILYIFKIKSDIPMSTTWVFIGLLGGRELAMAAVGASGGRTVRHALSLMGRDVLYVLIGLIVSLIIAMAINETIREAWLAPFGL
ncbi:MAG: hypothetical protein ACI81R_003823 [Bradymonadia bacterium]|jgi:hypothetical protein